MAKTDRRDQWGSRVGFILATSGAAVGLGNIQRFPYIAAQWGGGAFVLTYLLCVLILGLPLILVEFSLGRHTGKNPLHAIAALSSNRIWRFFGLLNILTAFFILTYYVVIAGWTLCYGIQALTGDLMPIAEFSAHAGYGIGASAGFLILSMAIVLGGLKNGIERISKIVMPVLFILLIALAVRSLTLPGGLEGLSDFLSFDFSKIGPQAIMFALSQAFFSLCIGEAVLVVYGSYTSKKDNLIASASYIAIFDTSVAILSGLIIFPALSAFSQTFDPGIGLIFDIMPQIFRQMPFGNVFSFAFFMILGFAALTTCIALMEIPVNFLINQTNISRKNAVLAVGFFAFLLSIPSALSHGASDFLSSISIPSLKLKGFYELMDFAWGSLGMVIGGLGISLFVAWSWGSSQALKELSHGNKGFSDSFLGRAWAMHIKYVTPIIIMAVIFSLFSM